MSEMGSQITSLTIVYSTVYSGTDQRKHQSSTSLAFVTGEFPAQMASDVEMLPFDDVIMIVTKSVKVTSLALDNYTSII